MAKYRTILYKLWAKCILNVLRKIITFFLQIASFASQRDSMENSQSKKKIQVALLMNIYQAQSRELQAYATIYVFTVQMWINEL